MTTLICSATTCYYNQDRLCSKGDIQVEGKNAQRMDETCCKSFRERGNSMTNAARTASSRINVSCDAATCKYNDNNKCGASSIGIDGSGASNCNETECHTFECQCGCRG